MYVEANQVEVWDLKGSDGSELGLFRVKAEWEGFRKLVRMSDGAELVVAPLETARSGLFHLVFGATVTVAPVQMTVVRADPRLIPAEQSPLIA